MAKNKVQVIPQTSKRGNKLKTSQEDLDKEVGQSNPAINQNVDDAIPSTDLANIELKKGNNKKINDLKTDKKAKLANNNKSNDKSIVKVESTSASNHEQSHKIIETSNFSKS